MESTLSISVKDWNSLQNQVVFQFSQEQVYSVATKTKQTNLISALKNYFLESLYNIASINAKIEW